MDRITIQRRGGIAGYGSPHSNIVSRGTVALDSLDANERKNIISLFELFKGGLPDTQSRDAFWYHIESSDGRTADVPEEAVPAALMQSIHDDFA